MTASDGFGGWTGHRNTLITVMALEAVVQMRSRCANSHQGPSLEIRLNTRPDISTQSFFHLYSNACRIWESI